MVNLAYVITRQLRRNGIDVELLMEKNPPKNSDPILFDPDLKNEYPNWIHFYDKSKSSWKLELIKKLRNKKYDLIQAYVELPIFAYLAHRPYIAHTQGSDLREMAMTNSTRGILLRKAYKKAKATIFFQPDYLSVLSKLKLKNAIFLPPLWDTDFYQPKKIERKEYSDKFLIFHATGLVWRQKGNDLFLKAFEKFSKTNPNVFLIIVDRGIDSKNTHRLVEKLGISSKIEFIPGPLNSSQLLYFYNLADVIVDQFVVGSLGSIAWEVFSCEKPLVAYIEKQNYEKLYGKSPPLVNAKSIEEICDALEYLKNEKVRRKLGKEARKWITKYHSASVFTEKLQKIYDSILEKRPLNEFFIDYKLTK